MAARRNTLKDDAQKVVKVLKDGLKGIAPDAQVLVAKGYKRDLHAYIISSAPHWKRLSPWRRYKRAQQILFKGLAGEDDLLGRVVMLFALTPEEYEPFKGDVYVSPEKAIAKG